MAAKAKPTPERDLLLILAKMVALMARHGNPKEMREELDRAIAAVEGDDA